MRERVLIGRFVKSEEVANIMALLASDEAKFITSVILPVDGGQCSKIG